MNIKETKVYNFDELPEDLQEKALGELHDCNVDYKWWDIIEADCKTIGEILGIEIKNMYFSGFTSQGDGACFEGLYYYAKGSVKKIKETAPRDTDLHDIAIGLMETQKTGNYQLYASVKQRGHYKHSGSTDIDVLHNNQNDPTREQEQDIKQELRNFMDWIYKQLEATYSHLTSEEAIKETIENNKWQFTKEGKLWT